jgi:hypothetical protein
MSEELVNQITLNYLISKNQLQKLNKKIKENTDNNRRSDKEIYKDRIQKLFNDLLVDTPPDDMLQEVKSGFEYFLDKCIYYFKAIDNNELLEKERNREKNQSKDVEDEEYVEDGEDGEDVEDVKDDGQDDNDLEDKEDEEDDYDLEDNNDLEQVKEIENNTFKNKTNIEVKPKYLKKNNISVGVENIQQLPLEWFQNVRQNYKKNKIIPRKKEIIIEDRFNNNEKKKI